MTGHTPEPNYATACGWWPDITGQYTAVGWKNHMFRFTVLYNGALLAEPAPRLIYAPWKRYKKWEGRGVQVNFPYLEAYEWWEHYGHGDDGMTRQGWADRPTPVLWTRWPHHGLLIQQEVFAYVPGTPELETGLEPLFAWVRMSIVDRLPALRPELPPYGRYPIDIRINRPHIIPTLQTGIHLIHQHDRSRYPRPLTPSQSYRRDRGYLLREPDGSVRLGLAGGSDCIVEHHDHHPTTNDRLVRTWLKPRVGQKIDLLVPMLPCDRHLFASVLRQGFNGALKQTDRFWRRSGPKGATIVVPEQPINDSIRRCMENAAVVTEKNPKDGHYSMLVASFPYPMIWSVQTAMMFAFALDPLGYHAEVDRCLETFRAYQGKANPPSPFLERHRGYLAAPPDRAAIPWLPDHGAMLYAVCRHAELTGDESFMDRWLESIVRACEFIYEARHRTGHGGVPGLLPPGSASDLDAPIQAVWTDGWHYKAYCAAIDLLKKRKDPRARRFAADAKDYKQTFVAAIRKATGRMPSWTDQRGRRHRLVPMSLHGHEVDKGGRSIYHCADPNGRPMGPEVEPRHPFYLDTGPLFLVFAGLLSARDPLMRSSLKWFREGPQHRHHRRDASRQVPVLDHEMSDSEPFYSWNVFHSHQLGDRHRFLEGMYSQFAGAMSRQTFTCGEHRRSQFTLAPQFPCFLMARLAIVDDLVAGNELHLLRLLPLAWLSSDSWAVFEDAPTSFGPVSVRFRLEPGRTGVAGEVQSPFRDAPRRLVLHIPPQPGIRKVILNNKPLREYQRGMKRVTLT